MWIWTGISGQQLAKILQSWRYRVDKVLLTLEISSEAVGTKHLQGAEEHEEVQTVVEKVTWRQRGILLGGSVVLIYQFLSKLVRIAGRGLSEEGSQVVVERAATTSLEVDEED